MISAPRAALILCNGLISSCLLASCSWIPWWGKHKEPQRFGVLAVRLDRPPPKGKQITYAAVTAHDDRKRKNLGLQPVTKDGEASFVLPVERSYDVQIFRDSNRNQALDAGEPNAQAEALLPSAPSDPDVRPFVMSFGIVGAAKGAALNHPAPEPRPKTKKPDLPPEAEPYLKLVPEWMQDKFLRQ